MMWLHVLLFQVSVVARNHHRTRLLGRASRSEQAAPRAAAAEGRGSVSDMHTTCGLLLSLNEVSWDSIHMDFELHKF